MGLLGVTRIKAFVLGVRRVLAREGEGRNEGEGQGRGMGSIESCWSVILFDPISFQRAGKKENKYR